MLKNYLSVAITQTKLLQRYTLTSNSRLNNAHVSFIAYVTDCITAAYQGMTKGKQDKNIIYNVCNNNNLIVDNNLNKQQTTTPVKEGIIKGLINEHKRLILSS